jgi:L-ribulose-5-phosphate 3-epimerase
VKEALDAIGYEGWLQIEGALPAGMDVMEAYRANSAFLRGVEKA